MTQSPTPPSLLIVDDDPTLVQMMGQMLAGLGTVRFARSGEAALRQAERERPDLVLMDAEMPGMNGFEACEALKAMPGLEDVPILFVTSHQALDLELRGFAVGAADFIHKPVSEAILRARVSTHLRLKRATDELRLLASTDALTGVPNRRSFDATLQVEWERAARSAQPLSVLMIDVDRFKQFNDLYGHIAGDACLRAIGTVLDTGMRRPGDFLARFGGEEFVAILPCTDGDGACRVAERLLASVRGLGIAHQQAVDHGTVSISVGVATAFAPSQGSLPAGQVDSAAALVQRADLGLYRAKEDGRARVCREVSDAGAVPSWATSPTNG